MTNISQASVTQVRTRRTGSTSKKKIAASAFRRAPQASPENTHPVVTDITPASAPKPEPAKTKVVSTKRPHEAVEPIKDPADIEKAKDYLRNCPVRYTNSPISLRNYMMFVININNGLRIGDLLSLHICDVLTEKGNVKTEVYIKESKTGKTRYLFLGPSSKAAIMDYLESLEDYHPSDYLFESRQRDKNGMSKPIGRKMAWQIIHDMGIAISEGREKPLRLGTHSLRKTFGYQRIQQNPNDPMIIAKVSDIYNHANLSTTYRYVGMDIEDKKSLCLDHEL